MKMTAKKFRQFAQFQNIALQISETANMCNRTLAQLIREFLPEISQEYEEFLEMYDFPISDKLLESVKHSDSFHSLYIYHDWDSGASYVYYVLHKKHDCDYYSVYRKRIRDFVQTTKPFMLRFEKDIPKRIYEDITKRLYY